MKANVNKDAQAQAQAQAQDDYSIAKTNSGSMYGVTVGAAAQAETTSPFSLDANAVKPAYCTIDTTTAQGKKTLYNATNRPDHNISEFINKKIRIKDIYVDVNAKLNTDKESDNYGVMEIKPRTVIIDENGESYIAGVSVGIFNSIREIIRIFGDPETWVEPLEVEVKQVSTKRGNMLTLEIV